MEEGSPFIPRRLFRAHVCSQGLKFSLSQEVWSPEKQQKQRRVYIFVSLVWKLNPNLISLHPPSPPPNPQAKADQVLHGGWKASPRPGRINTQWVREISKVSGWHRFYKFQVHKIISWEWVSHPHTVISPPPQPISTLWKKLVRVPFLLYPSSQYFLSLVLLQLNTTLVSVWNLPCEVERACNFPQFILLIYILHNNAYFFPSST